MLNFFPKQQITLLILNVHIPNKVINYIILDYNKQKLLS
jgi:hypothetical protein